MTIYQFNMLDEGEQIEAFWDAILVGEYEADGFRFECRQIDDFYVEYKKSDKFYVDMRTFRNSNLLQPYFDAADRK
jgi:hypothetical protein